MSNYPTIMCHPALIHPHNPSVTLKLVPPSSLSADHSRPPCNNDQLPNKPNPEVFPPSNVNLDPKIPARSNDDSYDKSPPDGLVASQLSHQFQRQSVFAQ